jgi:hypothetical protein
MQRRTFIPTLATLVLTFGSAGAQAQAVARVAVTDLAYTQAVSEYFEAATFKESANMQVNRHSASASYQGSGTYVAGSYSYMDSGWFRGAALMPAARSRPRPNRRSTSSKPAKWRGRCASLKSRTSLPASRRVSSKALTLSCLAH